MLCQVLALSCLKNFSAQSDHVLFCASDNKRLELEEASICSRLDPLFSPYPQDPESHGPRVLLQEVGSASASEHTGGCRPFAVSGLEGAEMSFPLH